MRYEKIQALRQALHQCPERSDQEYETIEKLKLFLQKNTTLELHPKDGWFYALHREEQATQTIAVRADMDAIENSHGQLFHGCGHDGHSAILAGLGLALEGKRLGKNVCLVFQPGEETGTGGKRVCRELFQERRPDFMLGCHNIPGKPWARCSCGEHLRLRVHGAVPGRHRSAVPRCLSGAGEKPGVFAQ